METVLDDDDDVPDPLPSSVPHLGDSPSTVPSDLSPGLHRKHVRLCRLRDRPPDPVTKLRNRNRLHRLS